MGTITRETELRKGIDMGFVTKKLLSYLIRLKTRIFLPFVIFYVLTAAYIAYAQAPMIEERLYYVRGNAADEETLLRANLPKAKGVIIFADQKGHEKQVITDPLLVDGKTLLIATAITAVEEKTKTYGSENLKLRHLEKRAVTPFFHVRSSHTGSSSVPHRSAGTGSPTPCPAVTGGR